MELAVKSGGGEDFTRAGQYGEAVSMAVLQPVARGARWST